jgi:flagellar hook protein FlgE
MASTTSLFTGLSGLTANARRLEVIGNNIANVNTTAFKSNRMLFSPTFNRNFSLGTAPTAASGGSNPGQVGLGVTIAGTQRNFNNGAISTTGISTDLALEGDGFFIVNRAGQQFYTRAGAFQFNSTNDLSTLTGERLQGYAVDDNFNVVRGRLVDVNIPLGQLTIAEATENVNFSGNLNSDGTTATMGTLLQIAAAGITAGTDLLTSLGGGAAIAAGDVFTISGAARGDKTIPDATFTVGAASDVDDLMDFLQQALGVVPAGGYTAGDPTGAAEPGGYTVNAGSVDFVGNFGLENDIDLSTANLTLADTAGVAKASPFSINKVSAADGESVRTTFVVYDSLGTPLEVDVTMVLAFKDDSGTYWRSFLHSADDTDLALHMENGDRSGTFSDAVPLLQFDNFGQLAAGTTVTAELDRTNTGASAPLSFELRFSTGADGVTALADTAAQSSIAAVFQDGSALGILSSFSVGEDGVITGGFTNGLTRTIGQIAMAKFTNPGGLVDAGNNLFAVGPNSGTALVTEPLNFGTGRIIGGALELSNVDLSQEFINMILTSTGYSASSRVITTTDQLIQQLLVLGR